MIHLRLLILLPITTYFISYFYLAYYHKKLSIFNTLIHEGGTYTLLQTIFYTSHFLGHIPVITVLALIFTGSYLSMTNVNFHIYSKKYIYTLLILILSLIIASFFFSLSVFGYEDTLSFIYQQKQAVKIYEHGGSWNLHLPSTMLLFLFIPVYIYIIKFLFGGTLDHNKSGLFYLSTGIIVFFIFTLFVNKNLSEVFFSIWRNPRYLAHSVRELLTFPVTYFPIPLFVLMRNEKSHHFSGKTGQRRNFDILIIFLAVVFLIGLSYQAYLPLSEGIGSLAQKPFFAKKGELGIPYLLASHYFEHFLDTIYFTLLSLFLYGIAVYPFRKTSPF